MLGFILLVFAVIALVMGGIGLCTLIPGLWGFIAAITWIVVIMAVILTIGTTL